MQCIARLTWERSLVQCLAQGHLDRWVIWALLPLTQNIVLVITFIGKCKLCRGRETKTSSLIGLFKSPASRLSPPPKWLTARCVHTVQGLAQFFISRPKFKQICWMWWDETTARPNNDSLSLCFLALSVFPQPVIQRSVVRATALATVPPRAQCCRVRMRVPRGVDANHPPRPNGEPRRNPGHKPALRFISPSHGATPPCVVTVKNCCQSSDGEKKKKKDYVFCKTHLGFVFPGKLIISLSPSLVWVSFFFCFFRGLVAGSHHWEAGLI